MSPTNHTTTQTRDAQRIYVAGHTKPRLPRATKAEMEERYRLLYQIVEANQPTGIRFTYYTASSMGLVPKTDAGYNLVQRAIKKMREGHRLPWSWIVDETRWMLKPTSYNSLQDALEDTAAQYRRSLWSKADVAVEVWCESRSISGVLTPVTWKWDVPLFPTNGQSSDSFVYSAAMSYAEDPRQLTIIYIGDHDPAGYEIQTNLYNKLVKHSGRTDITFTRLACTYDDVIDLDLSGSEPKKETWRNAITGDLMLWGDGPAVEVEAIPPPVLRERLDDAIAEYVPRERLRILKVAEESEREILRIFAREHGGAA